MNNIMEHTNNDLIINESDLANNPPSPPKLQDLDIWTKDEMRNWIKAYICRKYEFISNNSDKRSQQ